MGVLQLRGWHLFCLFISARVVVVMGNLSKNFSIVTSGCRCNTYNKKIGGAERSTHTFGMAADIQPADGDREGLIRAIEHLYQSGKLKD